MLSKYNLYLTPNYINCVCKSQYRTDHSLFWPNGPFPSYCEIYSRNSVEIKGIKFQCDPFDDGSGFTIQIQERKGDFLEYYTSPTRTVYLKENDGKLDHYFSNFRREGASEDDLYDYSICDQNICLRIIYWPNEATNVSNIINQFSKLVLHDK